MSAEAETKRRCDGQTGCSVQHMFRYAVPFCMRGCIKAGELVFVDAV